MPGSRPGSSRQSYQGYTIYEPGYETSKVRVDSYHPSSSRPSESPFAVALLFLIGDSDGGIISPRLSPHTPYNVTVNIDKMNFHPRNTPNPIMYVVPTHRLPQDAYNVDHLPPTNRAISPGRGERYGTYTPIQGRESPFRRPCSQMYRPMSRSSSRAGSRLEMGTQHWNYPRQTDPYGDDQMYRPYKSATSPRAPPIPLERGATFAGLSNEMDPFTKQYYNRLWRSQIPSTDLNLNRMGRAGGKWRHIESCIANTGSHITFVEGTVKQVDNAITGHVTPSRPRLQNRPLGRIPSIKRSTKYDNKFHEHATNGFKYWPHEQKPIDLASRLRLKARQVGLGY